MRVERCILDAEQHFRLVLADRAGPLARLRKDHPAQQATFGRCHARGFQCAAIAGWASARQHGLFDLVDCVILEPFGHRFGALHQFGQQFQFGHGFNAAAAIDVVDQPFGLRFVDIAARIAPGDQEFADCFDKGIAPFGRTICQVFVEDKQRFGFVGVDPSVCPAFAAQGEDFLCRDGAAGHCLLGQCAELHGHNSLPPQAPAWSAGLVAVL